MEKSYIVYKHTCPNGKCYIGITGRDAEKRWNNGRGYETQLFGKAINKYGWENIKHEILFSGLTLEEAYQKERECIATYHSLDRRFGYNCDEGGAGSSGHVLSERAIEEMRSKALKMWQDPQTREQLTRHLRELSKANIGSKRSANAIKATTDATSKKVLQYDREFNLVGEHDSLMKAASHIGVKGNSLLCRVCKEKNKTAYGFYWRYANEPITPQEIETLIAKKPYYNETPVLQITKSGEMVARFNSIHEAGRANGVSYKAIWTALTGRRPTAYGYIWRYA